MNAVENQVRELVAVELESANRQFPQFHSLHEGWAVMLEEIREMRDEMNKIDKHHDAMFFHIMHNSSALECAKEVREHALWAACEAIQVAAMAQKFRDMEANP